MAIYISKGSAIETREDHFAGTDSYEFVTDDGTPGADNAEKGDSPLIFRDCGSNI